MKASSLYDHDARQTPPFYLKSDEESDPYSSGTATEKDPVKTGPGLVLSVAVPD
jgi:hypothetical protein